MKKLLPVILVFSMVLSFALPPSTAFAGNMPPQITMPGVTVSARVDKIPGNTNILYITITDSSGTYTQSYTTANNEGWVYKISTGNGVYEVYVLAKGNVQIRACYLVSFKDHTGGTNYANYSALSAAIFNAALLNENIYTAESWAILAAAVANGKNVSLTLPASSQNIVDALTLAINNAIDGLVWKPINNNHPADYTALNNAMSAAEKLKNYEYTAESWAILVTAYTNGAAVARNLTVSSQGIIDSLANAINDAINGLVKKPIIEDPADYSALDNAIYAAELLNENEYTTDSWEVLVAAVEYGKAVARNLTVSSQGIIDSLTYAINDAVNNLIINITPVQDVDVTLTKMVPGLNPNKDRLYYFDIYLWKQGVPIPDNTWMQYSFSKLPGALESPYIAPSGQVYFNEGRITIGLHHGHSFTLLKLSSDYEIRIVQRLTYVDDTGVFSDSGGIGGKEDTGFRPVGTIPNREFIFEDNDPPSITIIKLAPGLNPDKDRVYSFDIYLQKQGIPVPQGTLVPFSFSTLPGAHEPPMNPPSGLLLFGNGGLGTFLMYHGYSMTFYLSSDYEIRIVQKTVYADDAGAFSDSGGDGGTADTGFRPVGNMAKREFIFGIQ